MAGPAPASPRPSVAARLRPLGLAFLGLSGCGQGPETTYGSMRGSSLNGTGAFAALLRQQGHTVRTAWRLTDELAEWADVVVRFAVAPGAPDRDEADWYEGWLESVPDRSLV